MVFINGLPTLRGSSGTPRVQAWEARAANLPLNPPGNPGEDCLRLKFRLNEQAQLIVEGEDLRTGESLPQQMLGPVR